MNYAFLSEHSVGWFSWIVSYCDEIVLKDCSSFEECHPVDGRISRDSEFCQNIFSRKRDIGCDAVVPNYGHDYLAGWSISEKEFIRIKRMIELYPLVKEFEKLKKYE